MRKRAVDFIISGQLRGVIATGGLRTTLLGIKRDNFEALPEDEQNAQILAVIESWNDQVDQRAATKVANEQRRAELTELMRQIGK